MTAEKTVSARIPSSDNSFKFGWMPPHPSFFVKREVYEKYGVFNTTLKSYHITQFSFKTQK